MSEKIENKGVVKTLSNKKEIDIIDLINILWHERKKIAIIISIITLLATFYALLATPWYSATVKILPSKKSSTNLINQYANLAAMVGVNIPISSEDQLSIYPEIIKSNFIIDKVLKNKFNTKKFKNPVTLFHFLGVEIDSTNKEESYKKIEKLKEIIRKEYIDANIHPKTHILTIKISVPEDPLLAKELANFIVKQLDIYNKFYRKYKASDQRKFIEKSLNETKLNMFKAEEELRNFQEKNKDLSSPEKQLKLQRLQTELNVQRTLYIELKKQLELIKIEEIKETETLDVLEYATEPIKKSKPNRLLIIFTSIILSVFLSIFYVFFINIVKKIRK
ncbi:MAG: Wzz/FepE/Etk N-terminal domain-containing protein [Candidatus Helarchaeota archaeon]